jgi:LacI family transcriptional regulator
MAGRRTIRRVGLLISDASDNQRRILNGILAWHREHGHWQIHSRGFLPMMGHRDLAKWKGDGLIAMIDDARQYAQILRKKVPAVNCSARLPTPKVSAVLSDNSAIGRMAASHLLENGFRNFAFVGETRFMHDLLRFVGFKDALRERGFPCARVVPVFRKRTRYLYAEAEIDARQLAHQLKKLAKPLGILAAHDDIGCWTLEACKQAGLAVPDEISIVGVNNHQWLCEMATPHLSSIAQDADKIGYEAAALLDRLMDADATAPRLIQIPPARLVMRASSDALASEDAALARALRFIRNHGCEDVDVSTIARHANLSRRAIELRFRQHLNRSIGEEIERVRMDRARQLLAETIDPVYDVALQSGYRNYHTFCVAFQRAHAIAPTKYREKKRRKRGS